MAFLTGATSTGRGRFRGSSTLSEINIVPLVYVVLVLLIIFMLTAHVMEFGLEVEVPKVKQEKTSVQDLPIVLQTANGDLYLGDKPVNLNELVQTIRTRYPKANEVYYRADKRTIWDVMASVISVLGQGKYQVRMVTQPDDGKK